MSHLHDVISGDSPQDAETLLQVIKDTREDLIDIRKGLGKVANVGSDIAAGSFNQGVEDLRHLIWESPLAKAVGPTLEFSPPPSRTSSATRCASARCWRRIGGGHIRSAPSAPSPSTTPAPPIPRRGGLGGRNPRSPSRSLLTAGLREKPTALPPRRGKARRTSESFKGGRGGDPGLSVPSPNPLPCHASLSICPRPTTIWRSRADCATSFRFARKNWRLPHNSCRPWRDTIQPSRPHRLFLIRE
jgi:hypothetical protein